MSDVVSLLPSAHWTRPARFAWFFLAAKSLAQSSSLCATSTKDDPKRYLAARSCSDGSIGKQRDG